MNDHDVMVLIRTKRESCVFTTVELSIWLTEAIEGLSRNAAIRRVKRLMNRLPVELLSKRFYRLLVIPDEVKDETTKKIVKKEKTDVSSIAREILDYLNLKAGTKYKGKPADILKIKARLAPPESFTLDDFKTVIDKKVKEWKGTSMEQYLRPETLFSNKFEGYLNQTGSANKGKADEMAGYDFNKYL